MRKLSTKRTINNLAKPGENLSQRAVRGGFWVFSLRIINRLFGLTRTIILARLLSPNDFGLFGIALLALSALETFSQTGFRQALIQKKEDIKPYLNTAWTVQIIRGVLIALILFFIAPYVTNFFETPAAEPILKVIGLAIVLQSLTNIAVLYFEKELKFHKYFIYQFAGTIADVAVAISAAFLLRSVWALVLGLLAGNLVRCIVSYIIDSYRPRFQFNKSQAKELFGFGKWILGSSVLVFLLTQGDDIFVGKLLGATMLGFYQMAYRISNLSAIETSQVISRVTLPVYSRLQDNLPKLREAYLKVLQVTAFLSFLIAGLMFILAPDFTMIFLGEKWMPIVPAMMALSIFGITRAINATTGPIFQGIGKPNISTFGSIFQLGILVVVIYPLTSKWGILGTSIAIIMPSIAFMFYNGKKLMNAMNYKLVHLINPLLSSIIGSITMCLIIFFFKLKIWSEHSLISFIALILLGIGIYLFMVCLTDKFFGHGLKDNLKQLFKKA